MMKSNELMIGDLVEPHQCRIPTLYCKVEGIYPDNTVHLDKAERLFSLDELNPIPLTAEILEKNGFVYNDLPFVQAWEQYGLSIYGDGLINCGQNITLKCQYVHQLQHVLRQCGIDNEIKLED